MSTGILSFIEVYMETLTDVVVGTQDPSFFFFPTLRDMIDWKDNRQVTRIKR